MLDTLLLIGGLALILLGANGLTDGSAAVAKRFRISDLVIGLTIVAFGTSAPELVISVLSALNGSAEMAIGNVVGSNTFNALMIIGCTAVVLPIKVGEGTMSKEIPLVILSSLVLFFCANDVMLDQGNENIIGRIDGLILLAFFLIFLRYTRFLLCAMPGSYRETLCPVPSLHSTKLSVQNKIPWYIPSNLFCHRISYELPDSQHDLPAHIPEIHMPASVPPH